MPDTHVNSVDDYIALQPRAVQPVLERLRSIVRQAVPGAEEVLSYKMPAYKVREGVVLYFGAWKKHFSLYPCTEALVAAFGNELEPYELSYKGTIRFSLSQPIPVKLIERIARFRAKEVVARHNRMHSAKASREASSDRRGMGPS
jgi:uncharacterized protein YdhG (YjbR/CyaY superfamily)